MGKQTIFFWGRRAEYTVGMVVLVSAAYAGMILLMNEFDGGEELIKTISFYTLSMGCIFPLTLPMSLAEYDIPLTVSMGARRKETFWNIQIMNMIYWVEMSLVESILLFIATKHILDMRTMFCVMSAMVLFLSSTMGEYILCASIRWGKKGGAIMALVITALIVGIGTLVVFKVLNGGMQFDFDFTVFYSIPTAIVLGCAYLIGAVLLWNTIKKLEVHR